MKAKVLALVFALVVVGLLPALGAAQNAAVVIKDTACTVLDVDGQTPFTVQDSVKVTTKSANQNRNVSCHGDLADRINPTLPPPPSAQTFDYKNTGGVLCCSDFNGTSLSTSNWHETITPSGNVTLTCHFKGDESTLCPSQTVDCSSFPYGSDDRKSCCESNSSASGCRPT
jgi:hypothetical protein